MFVARADRGDTPDAHSLARAEVSRSRRGDNAGHTALEQLAGTGHLTLVVLVHHHLADGARYQTAALGSVTNHHDIVHQFGLFVEYDRQPVLVLRHDDYRAGFVAEKRDVERCGKRDVV